MQYVYREMRRMLCCFFFFNDTATTEIYTLSLHDALPISEDYLTWSMPPDASTAVEAVYRSDWGRIVATLIRLVRDFEDRKSTRLNSHLVISYAVFCLKKKTSTNLEVS